MRHGNRRCRCPRAPGLLVMRLTTEQPIGDILQYHLKTGYNDALKRNRTLVTIPSAYTHFCAQACQGDIYKTVVYERCGI